MRHTNVYNRCMLFLLASFIHLVVNAQIPALSPVNGVVPAVFNTTGGSYDNPQSYYRFEWSFGELLVIQAMAPADSSVLLTHGVLQPCTDIIGKTPGAVVFENGEYKLFPNPTDGKFELDFFVRQSGQMKLQLINSLGQLLESRSYSYDGCCRIELFDLTRLPAGIYYVVADLDNGAMRRHSGFKVIKLSGK
ncbi:MAG: hypothetical protein ABIT05_00225 [Chitinophagaceae bacterium]